MPRRPALDRQTLLNLALPESVRARLDLFLFSPLEGRVPLGSYRTFFLERIQEFFDSRQLDLAPFGFPAGFYVRGPRTVIDQLEERLKNGNS